MYGQANAAPLSITSSQPEQLLVLTRWAPSVHQLPSDGAVVREQSPHHFHLMKKLFAVAAIATLSFGVAPAAWAGSATAQSIWNSGQAMSRARQRVPAGAEITERQCSAIDTGRNTVWTCKVSWQ